MPVFYTFAGRISALQVTLSAGGDILWHDVEILPAGGEKSLEGGPSRPPPFLIPAGGILRSSRVVPPPAGILAGGRALQTAPFSDSGGWDLAL